MIASSQTIAAIQARRKAQGLKAQKSVRLAKPPDARAEARRLAREDKARLGRLLPILEAALPQIEAVQAMVQADRPAALARDARPRWRAVLDDILAGIFRAYYQTREEEDFRQDAEAAHAETSARGSAYLDNAYRRVLGVDLYTAEPWLASEMETAVEEHVSRIVSIESDLLGRVRDQVTRAVTSGIRVEELRAQLHKTYAITKGRADFIARDQLGTWNGRLMQLRQRAAGGQKYVWRTSRDERVVGNPAGRYPRGSRGHQDHFHREGKVFSWDDPPSDGHPGEAFQCRCTAEPVIPELEDIEAPRRAAELPPEATAAYDPLAFVRATLQNPGPATSPPAGLR